MNFKTILESVSGNKEIPESQKFLLAVEQKSDYDKVLYALVQEIKLDYRVHLEHHIENTNAKKLLQMSYTHSNDVIIDIIKQIKNLDNHDQINEIVDSIEQTKDNYAKTLYDNERLAFDLKQGNIRGK